MSESLALNPTLYAEATAAGAFYAVAGRRQDSSRRLLLRILKEGSREPLGEEALLRWSGSDDPEQALELLYRLQRLDFVHGTEHPAALPESSLESVLQGTLVQLSDSGRALLTDDNGFYLAAAGFHHEAAEEIAALAGDMLAVSERHSLLLRNNLNITSSAWAISDPTGKSELAFFPLYIGRQAFVLALSGTPQLQGEPFVMLIRALSNRYG